MNSQQRFFNPNSFTVLLFRTQMPIFPLRDAVREIRSQWVNLIVEFGQLREGGLLLVRLLYEMSGHEALSDLQVLNRW